MKRTASFNFPRKITIHICVVPPDIMVYLSAAEIASTGGTTAHLLSTLENLDFI